MKREFSLRDIVEMNSAILHYNTDLLGMMSQPTRDETALIEWNIKLKGGTKNWWWDTGYNFWSYMNIHSMIETWPSTAGGWGGIGGSAITSSYTTIIHNTYLNFIAVYYGGKLAYVKDASNFDLNKIESYSKVKDYLYKTKRF